jgi:hypothetical protein
VVSRLTPKSLLGSVTSQDSPKMAYTQSELDGIERLVEMHQAGLDAWESSIDFVRQPYMRDQADTEREVCRQVRLYLGHARGVPMGHQAHIAGYATACVAGLISEHPAGEPCYRCKGSYEATA